MAHKRLRWPIRSATTPKEGDSSVPTYRSAPNSDSNRTEPVSARMYQPRMSASISKAQEVERSEGHCKRKLRTRNGASTEGRSGAVKPPHGGLSWAHPPSRPARFLVTQRR